ncbi:MAG: pyridoxal-phosphate dependent enzyme, partial [Scytonema sp. PMC 1069.18]|nr:pyridoxal-phosphate dependent enzyme [Scytonema sp. PMC 1069.18]
MLTEFFNIPKSPIQEVFDETLIENNIRLFIKRDDLLHPLVSGNKFRKLKYNILKIKEQGFQKLVTFGGAFSNHIHATAAAGRYFDIETIGIIRGDRTEPLNPTLHFAENCGMKLHFVSRSDFRDKSLIIKHIEREFDNFYFLSEGGSNSLAVRGCMEIVEEIHAQMPFQPDYFCTACGTGGTLAGIIAAAKSEQKVIGFSALKGDFLKNDVQKLLDTQKNISCKHWHINDNYCFGGYAKWHPELIHFINKFKKIH